MQQNAHVIMLVMIIASYGFATESPPETEQMRVLVLPFAASDAGSAGWIADSLQKTLITDLGRLGDRVIAVAPKGSTKPVANIRDALEAVGTTGASAVVFGTFRVAGSRVELRGQIVSVSSGKSLGELKASGSLRDLFAVEDEISAQLRKFLLRTQAQANTPSPMTRPVQAFSSKVRDDLLDDPSRARRLPTSRPAAQLPRFVFMWYKCPFRVEKGFFGGAGQLKGVIWYRGPGYVMCIGYGGSHQAFDPAEVICDVERGIFAVLLRNPETGEPEGWVGSFPGTPSPPPRPAPAKQPKRK